MEKEKLRRLVSDVRKSKEMFGLSAHLIVPMDIPKEFAEEYVDEFYPFFLFKDMQAQIRYYNDFQQVIRMEQILKPVIYSVELVSIKKYSLKYKSNTKDFDKVIKALEDIGNSYKFKKKFLSIKEVKVMYPLHQDFISYEDDVKKSIKMFLKEAVAKSKSTSDFEEFDSNLEMLYISLYRMVVYGLYTLPIDEQTRNKLEEIINNHEKEEIL